MMTDNGRMFTVTTNFVPLWLLNINNKSILSIDIGLREMSSYLKITVMLRQPQSRVLCVKINKLDLITASV